jgi:hypothetical protein
MNCVPDPSHSGHTVLIEKLLHTSAATLALPIRAEAAAGHAHLAPRATLEAYPPCHLDEQQNPMHLSAATTVPGSSHRETGSRPPSVLRPGTVAAGQGVPMRTLSRAGRCRTGQSKQGFTADAGGCTLMHADRPESGRLLHGGPSHWGMLRAAPMRRLCPHLRASACIRFNLR